MPARSYRPPAQDLPLVDLIATAKRQGEFGCLLAALRAAGLSKLLRGEGPFTLFAPTDTALGRLPPGELDGLFLSAQAPRLLAVLRHHLLNGRLQAQDFLGRQLRVTTLQGDDLVLDGHHGLRADQAHVLRSDQRASNGLLHSIDALLLPVAR